MKHLNVYEVLLLANLGGVQKMCNNFFPNNIRNFPPSLQKQIWEPLLQPSLCAHALMHTV